MSNIKSDPSKLPESSDHAEIRKQVEFYFSDENLPTDKFLWKTTQANHGWVPISTIHNFKRMRRFQPEEAVVKALEESHVLEVSDGKVRRKVPLKEPNSEEKKSAFSRTVYAKGFGTETETTQFDIEKYFSQFGETKQVRLRRADDGTFKGSVFVEFSNVEDADKFVADKPKYNDEELLVMSKQAYTEMKAAEHGFSSNANGKRRRFNAFKEKPKRKERPAKRTRRDNKGKDSKDESVKDSETKNESESKESTEQSESKEQSEPKEDAKEAASTEEPKETEPAKAEPEKSEN